MYLLTGSCTEVLTYCIQYVTKATTVTYCVCVCVCVCVVCSPSLSSTLPSPPLQSKDYHYTKLKDIADAGLKINVFGVVKTFNQPRKSKGGTGQKGVGP